MATRVEFDTLIGKIVKQINTIILVNAPLMPLIDLKKKGAVDPHRKSGPTLGFPIDSHHNITLYIVDADGQFLAFGRNPLIITGSDERITSLISAQIKERCGTDLKVAIGVMKQYLL